MKIGKKIKELRRQRKMKLVELADKTGIQIATLSRIEHDKMTGTLASHIKIAEALNIELTDLYQNIIQSSKIQPEAQIRRINADTFSLNDKASYEILTGNLTNKKMMPIMMQIEPQGRTVAEHGKPGSERFLFVLKGRLTAHLEEKAFTLKQNHSLYFDYSIEHWLENTDTATVKFISVVTPAIV